MLRPGPAWVNRTRPRELGRSRRIARQLLRSTQSESPAASGARSVRRASDGVAGASATLHDDLTLRLAGGPEAAARARRSVARLRADLDPPLTETLRLLVTELVANAVKHAAAESLTLRIVVGRSAVLTEVTDQGPGFDPANTGAPRTDHTGWGLFLVERLADRWGVARDGRCTRVWFELKRG